MSLTRSEKAEEKRHCYRLGRFGQTIDYLKADGIVPSSYREVLASLKEIKSEFGTEEVIIFHAINPHYYHHKDTPWLFKNIHIDYIDNARDFVRDRQWEELANKWNQIGKLYYNFGAAIRDFSSKGGDPKIKESLTNLMLKIRTEIDADRCYLPGEIRCVPYIHTEIRCKSGKIPGSYDEEPEFKGPDLNKTYYPVVLKHFIEFTKKISKHPNNITKDEVEKSEIELEKKLKGHIISEKLRSIISGVFAALGGFIIGAVVGCLATGGLGAIPGGMIGASVGLTSGGFLGFFHAKKHNHITEARKEKFDIIDDNGVRPAQPEQHARDTLKEIKNSINSL